MLAAAITAVTFSLSSYHFDSQFNHMQGFNERNPGAIVELNERWLVGAYVNSYEKTTVLAGRRFRLGSAGPVRFHADVALDVNHSYRYPVVAMACASVNVLTVCGVPRFHTGGGGTLGFAVTFPVK